MEQRQARPEYSVNAPATISLSSGASNGGNSSPSSDQCNEKPTGWVKS
jgi:hypothetical protein